MTPKSTNQGGSAALRRRAESRLRTQPKAGLRPAAGANAEADIRRLYHELQVHQVELELQNAELMAARETAERSLENYTDLYDFAPVGYFTLTDDGAIQLVNLTGASLVGMERSRLVGRAFGSLVPAALRPVFNYFLKQVFAGNGRQSLDIELWRPGLPLRLVNLEAQRLPDGQTCRAAMMDITERRQAVEKTRSSEIRYRRLFEAAHDGVLLLDATTGKITDANPFMTHLLGYPNEQLIGKELFEIGLLQDAAASREMFRKLKVKREVRYEDLPLESREGRHQEVEVVANLYLENGRPVIQCNIRDITARKLAEEILRRNEALFSALIEQAPVGVYVVDAQLRVQQVNSRARPAFGKGRPPLGRELAHVLRVIWPRPTAEEITNRFRHTLQTGKPYLSPDFSERRRDLGQTEFYEWQLQRVTLPAGEHGVVCFFNNITARKHAEEVQRSLAVLTASNQKLEREIIQRQAVEATLKQSEQHQRELLEQSRHMEGQLRHLSRQMLQVQEEERKRISRELHDVIAQTLTGINVRLATLKKGAGLNRSHFEQDLEGTQRLVENSVNIVHQFARELRPAVLDDLGLIPALHAFLKEFTEQTGVHTHLVAFAGLEQLELDRRTILFRVAQEALTNVARHARASRVEVKMEKLATGVRMKISDNGQAFNVQAKGSKRLGLLGMRERLEMVGGRFEIEPVPGQGTTVIAEMPWGKREKKRR